MTNPTIIPQTYVAPWKSMDEVRKATLDYIIARKSGLIQSLKTPWPRLNNAMLGGLEWGGFFVLAARPGVGKTAMVNQITQAAHALNPTQDFAILNFQFEMSDKMIGARELTGFMEMDLKQLFSSEGAPQLSNEDIKKMASYHVKRRGEQVFTVDKVRSVIQFGRDVRAFYKAMKKPIVVTLDHSLLIKREANELVQLDTLYALAAEIVELKKAIPDIIFIVLTQMNRNIEDKNRKTPKDSGNYPNSGDIFGGDALMQNCDVTIALNRPHQLGVQKYGDQGFIVKPEMLVAHFIKNRYGELGMLFMKEDLKHFRLLEDVVPKKTV